MKQAGTAACHLAAMIIPAGRSESETMDDNALRETIRLVIAKDRQIAHLETVLRRKNRRIAAQHEQLVEQRRRILGLLSAFDDVQGSTMIEGARSIAAAVLEFDEREYLRGLWKSPAAAAAE
jgi:hypothetical protein